MPLLSLVSIHWSLLGVSWLETWLLCCKYQTHFAAVNGSSLLFIKDQKRNLVQIAIHWIYFPLMHCYHNPLLLAACNWYWKASTALKSLVFQQWVNTVCPFWGSVEARSGCSLWIFGDWFPTVLFSWRWSLQTVKLNEDSVMSLVISICICSPLNGKGGSPEANSEFDGLKCPWMCLFLPQTPKLILWEQLERPSWDHDLHYYL